MNELYQAIEDQIRAAGYEKPVSGEEIYNEICDEIEEKENGTYLFLSKKQDDDVFEYKIVIHDENFNLSYIRITSGEQIYHADFGEE